MTVTERLANTRPAVCETPNCHAPSVRMVLNTARNTTSWYCEKCSTELLARCSFLKAVVTP
jgi:hypothetical protein